MREILFKAKAINRDKGYHRTIYQNGDWVYGLVTRLYDERFENLPAEMTEENGVSGIEIDHNTICQYTGLTDRSGSKIWENDIVVAHFRSNKSRQKFKIIFEDGMFLFDNSCVEVPKCDVYGIEVIGNIFDNSELIGE